MDGVGCEKAVRIHRGVSLRSRMEVRSQEFSELLGSDEPGYVLLMKVKRVRSTLISRAHDYLCQQSQMTEHLRMHRVHQKMDVSLSDSS